MAEFAAGCGGLKVHQQPDAPGGCTHHIELTGTQQRYISKPELSGTCGRKSGVEVIGGGEHHTDQVVVPKSVTHKQFTQQFHHGSMDVVGVVPLNSCGTPQGSHWHAAMLPIL